MKQVATNLSMMRRYRWIVLLLWMGVFLWSLAGGVPLASCGFIPPPTYSAEAIEAWVVDEDTGQPLAGVIVVAHWELMGGLHPDAVGQLMVMETVTDEKGRFAFSAWGPKLRPVSDYLDARDPELLLFKSDYHYKVLANEVTSEVNTSSVRRSEWNKQTVKLKKFTGSAEEWAKKVAFIDSSIDFAFQHHDCSWKQIPHMLVAITQEVRLLRAKKFFANFNSIEQREEQANPAKCGSIREFLRSHTP